MIAAPAPHKWSFLNLTTFRAGSAEIGTSTVTIELTSEIAGQLGLDVDEIIIKERLGAQVARGVRGGEEISGLFKFTHLHSTRGVLVPVSGRRIFALTGLPENWRGVSLGMRASLLQDGSPDLFKGLLKHSGILLSACLIAYSLSQVDWQNLTLSQSLASVALCGLGMDPNLVA